MCVCYHATLKEKTRIEPSNFHEWEWERGAATANDNIVFVSYQHATAHSNEWLSQIEIKWIKNDKQTHTHKKNVHFNAVTNKKKQLQTILISYFNTSRHIHIDFDFRLLRYPSLSHNTYTLTLYITPKSFQANKQ